MDSMDIDSSKWTWTTNTKGRIISVSPRFGIIMGNKANKSIIGNSFWKFCDNIDAPTGAWADLNKAFEEKRKILTFVFNYSSGGGKIVKVKISGKPVFKNDQYTGHSGIGMIADDTDLTSFEMSKTGIVTALEELRLGVGIFNDKGNLEDFNSHFKKLLLQVGITVEYDTKINKIISHLKAYKSYRALSVDLNEKSNIEEFMITLNKGKSQTLHVYCDYKSYFGSIIKIEISNNINNYIKKNITEINSLKQNQKLLSSQLDLYKQKMELAIQEDKKSLSTPKNTPAPKAEETEFLSFYMSQIDVGILVTDLEGNILDANFYVTDIFEYRSVKDLLQKAPHIKDITGYDPNRRELTDKMLSDTTPRLERDIYIQLETGFLPYKEVISFYPSVSHAQKIISFLYRIEDKITPPPSPKPLTAKLTARLLEYSFQDMLQLSQDSTKQNTLKQTFDIKRYIQETYTLYNMISDSYDIQYSKINIKNILTHTIDIFGEDNFDLPPIDSIDLVCDETILTISLIKIFSCMIQTRHNTEKITFDLIYTPHNNSGNIQIKSMSSISFKEILSQSPPQDLPKELLNLSLAETILNKSDFPTHITSVKEFGNIIDIDISHAICNQDKNNASIII